MISIPFRFDGGRILDSGLRGDLFGGGNFRNYLCGKDRGKRTPEFEKKVREFLENLGMNNLFIEKVMKDDNLFFAFLEQISGK